MERVAVLTYDLVICKDSNDCLSVTYSKLYYTYSNFKVREQWFFFLLQNSKKIPKIRDQNIPILSEKCYNSGLHHDT